MRWGILATGGIAATFVEDLQHVPDAEVRAVGSRTQAAADAFAARYGIPRAYGDWDALAADDELDVIYVATPHQAHYDAAGRCVRAGQAVLCEKPLTLDATTSRDLIDTARTAGVFLMEAVWTRCNPLVRRLCRLVADGAIGEVTTVHADFGLAGPYPPEHRLRAPELGGGALLDLGIYPLTMAHLMLGAPDTVAAWGTRYPEGTDAQTGMLLGYDSGAMAALTCGSVGATGTRAVVTGTRGRIEIDPMFHCPTTATLHRDGTEPERLHEPLTGHGYVPEAEEVQRCLRAGLPESPLVPHSVSLALMELMDDIRARVGVRYADTLQGSPA